MRQMRTIDEAAAFMRRTAHGGHEDCIAPFSHVGANPICSRWDKVSD